MRLLGKINRENNYEISEPSRSLHHMLQIVLFCVGIIFLIPTTLQMARSSKSAAPNVQIQQSKSTPNP